MKQLYCAIVICFCALMSSAQVDSTGIQDSTDSLRMKNNQFASKSQQKLDSLQSLTQSNTVTDTSKYYQQKLDSVQQSLTQQLDSLQSSCASVISRINQPSVMLKTRIDSLTNLNLPKENILPNSIA